MKQEIFRRLASAAALALLANAAGAHDTWFEVHDAAAGGSVLALGTGDQYPRHETGIDAKYLVGSGCRSASNQAVPLQPLRDAPDALLMRAGPGAQSCWAQTAPFDVELPPDKVALYLREVGAGPELRAQWVQLQRRGLAWKERYAKHARIVLGPGGVDDPGPPMAIDAKLETASPRQGQPLVVQVLRDGQPLAGFPVELRNGTLPVGLWRRTDAQGRVHLATLPAGRWLLRGIDLRLQPDDTWDSRFVTLAFEVLK